MSSEPTVPTNATSLEPGVKSSYRNGWRQMKKYFLELLLIGVIYFLLAEAIALPMNIVTLPSSVRRPGASLTPQMLRVIWAFSGLALIYSIFVAFPLMYGLQFAYLKAARGDKLETKHMFEGFRNYWNAILANLLIIGIMVIALVPLMIAAMVFVVAFAGSRTFRTSLPENPLAIAMLVAGFILLMMPMMICTLKLTFTPYLVTDRKMGPVEAVKESWRMTGGHTWTIFFIGLLSIPMMIAGLLILVVGLIPASMWVTLANASLFHAVSLTRANAPAPTPAAP